MPSVRRFLYSRRDVLYIAVILFYAVGGELTVVLDAELGHHFGKVKSEGLELLQQREDQRRRGLGKAADPARMAVAVPITSAMVDHDDLVDLAERLGHGLEDG